MRVLTPVLPFCCLQVNHGIQVCYGFCEGSGSMERSRYFGYSKDLYHFDHFLGQFQNAFPELLGLESFEIVEVQEGDEPLVQVSFPEALPRGSHSIC